MQRRMRISQIFMKFLPGCNAKAGGIIALVRERRCLLFSSLQKGVFDKYCWGTRGIKRKEVSSYMLFCLLFTNPLNTNSTRQQNLFWAHCFNVPNNILLTVVNFGPKHQEFVGLSLNWQCRSSLRTRIVPMCIKFVLV